jgi:hypothetical protein
MNSSIKSFPCLSHLSEAILRRGSPSEDYVVHFSQKFGVLNATFVPLTTLNHRLDLNKERKKRNDDSQ